MLKNYQQFINEDLRSKKITLPEIKIDNLQKLYPNIKVNYNDDFKIVISYNETLKLNEEFYKILENDNIKIEDIIFENCKDIEIYDINNFKKISDYGKFGEGIKDFYCSFCKNLQSLKGCPETINGGFYCYSCDKLQNLEGSPEKVGGYFNCRYCKNLQSLEGCPKEVGGYFSCSYCKNLQSLEGAPEKVGGDFNCKECSLDFIELAKQKYGDKVKYK